MNHKLLNDPSLPSRKATLPRRSRRRPSSSERREERPREPARPSPPRQGVAGTGIVVVIVGVHSNQKGTQVLACYCYCCYYCGVHGNASIQPLVSDVHQTRTIQSKTGQKRSYELRLLLFWLLLFRLQIAQVGDVLEPGGRCRRGAGGRGGRGGGGNEDPAEHGKRRQAVRALLLLLLLLLIIVVYWDTTCLL